MLSVSNLVAVLAVTVTRLPYHCPVVAQPRLIWELECRIPSLGAISLRQEAVEQEVKLVRKPCGSQQGGLLWFQAGMPFVRPPPIARSPSQGGSSGYPMGSGRTRSEPREGESKGNRVPSHQQHTALASTRASKVKSIWVVCFGACCTLWMSSNH